VPDRRIKFTDKTIAALKPRQVRYEVWAAGGQGFGVRISPRGVRSFVLLYRYEGRQRRLTFGTYPRMTLADANLALAAARKRLERGEDPGVDVVQQKAAERHAETFAELSELYLEKWARPRKRSAAEDERVLRREAIPRWGRRKAKDVRRRDVVALLDDIVTRGAPIAANRTLALLRKVFNFGISRSIEGLSENPCRAVKMPAPEMPRERVLADHEIGTLWRGLETAPLGDSVRLALRFILATGQRPGEVVAARWEQIDCQRREWAIPSTVAKNRREHLVPLSPLAIAVLQDAERVQRERLERSQRLPKRRRAQTQQTEADQSAYLFPSTTLRDLPITPQALQHAVIRTLRIDDDARRLPLAAFSPHDLRRTVATGLGRLGVSRFVIGRVLNHVEAGVTGRHYDRHDYLPEKFTALDRWGTHLEGLLKLRPSAEVVALAERGRR